MKPFNVSKRFVILRLATSLWTNMQKRTVCPYIDCCIRRNLWIVPIISQTGKLLSHMHCFIQHAPSDLKCSRSYSLDGAVGNTYTNPQVCVLLRTILYVLGIRHLCSIRSTPATFTNHADTLIPTGDFVKKRSAAIPCLLTSVRDTVL